MAKGKQIYTQQGYDELVKELHFLKHEKREQIKNDIAGISVSIAEKVVERQLNEADQEKLVSQFIENLGGAL